MDNKKIYKQFGTLFWWTLTLLPLIVVLINFIGYHLTFNSGITSAQELSNYHYDTNGNFIYILEDYMLDNNFNFSAYSMGMFNAFWNDMFNLIGVRNYDYLNVLFGWMTSVQFYHLLFDFIVWLPRFFHSILDKGVGKVEGK